MLKDHNAVTPVRLEPAASRSRGKYSNTEPLLSQSGKFTQVLLYARNIRKDVKNRCPLTRNDFY